MRAPRPRPCSRANTLGPKPAEGAREARPRGPWCRGPGARRGTPDPRRPRLKIGGPCWPCCTGFTPAAPSSPSPPSSPSGSSSKSKLLWLAKGLRNEWLAAPLDSGPPPDAVLLCPTPFEPLPVPPPLLACAPESWAEYAALRCEGRIEGIRVGELPSFVGDASSLVGAPISFVGDDNAIGASPACPVGTASSGIAATAVVSGPGGGSWLSGTCPEKAAASENLRPRVLSCRRSGL